MCFYKEICKYYKPHCIQEYCWRANYLNGMLDDKIKNLIKEGKLEIVLKSKSKNLNNLLDT